MSKHIFHIICFIGLMVIGFASCRKVIDLPGGGDESVEPIGPKDTELIVKVVDGVLNRNGVLSLPSVVFSVKCVDEAANFVIEYSVDGGPRKTLKNIWDGTEKKIDADFKDFKTYGKHVVRGVLYEKDDKENVHNFEKDVWMLYEPVEVSDECYFSMKGRTVSSKDANATLYVTEYGFLQIDYTPATSLAEVSVSDGSGKGIMSFDESKMDISSGRFSVPFSVEKEGRALVCVDFVNGPGKIERSFEVRCVKDETVTTVKASVSMSSFVQLGTGCEAIITLDEGNIDVDYDLDMYLDGVSVGSAKGVSMASGYKYMLEASSLTKGSHVFKVTCRRSDGKGSESVVEKNFEVIDISLSADGVTVAKDGTSNVEVGKRIVMAIRVKDEWNISNITLSSVSEGISITESGKAQWMVVSRTRGKKALELKCSIDGNIFDYTYEIGFLETDTLVAENFGHEEYSTHFTVNRPVSGDAGYDLNVSVSVEYAICVDITFAQEGGFHQNTPPSPIYVVTGSGTEFRKISGSEMSAMINSFSFFDLRQDAKELMSKVDLSDYPKGSRWVNKNGTWYIEEYELEPYFTITKVSYNVVPLNVKEGDCLVFNKRNAPLSSIDLAF